MNHLASRIVPLFPLPDLVMFPRSLQMLYIFEPRYVQMIQHAIKAENTIGMALLKRGWEHDYDLSPPIHDTICLGRIVSYAEKSNGHFNLLLSGFQRASVIREIDHDFLYRIAEVKPIAELNADKDVGWGLEALLCEKIRNLLVHAQVAEELLENIKREGMKLNEFVDVISFALPMKLESKQQLLTEPSVELRAQFLIDFMSNQGMIFPTLEGRAPSGYSLN